MSGSTRRRFAWWRTGPDGRRRPTAWLVGTVVLVVAWWIRPAGDATDGPPPAASRDAGAPSGPPAGVDPDPPGWPPGSGPTSGVLDGGDDPLVGIWRGFLAPEAQAEARPLAGPAEFPSQEGGADAVSTPEATAAVTGAVEAVTSPPRDPPPPSAPVKPVVRAGAVVVAWFLGTVRTDVPVGEVELAVAPPGVPGLAPPDRLVAVPAGSGSGRMRFEVVAVQRPDGSRVALDAVVVDPRDGAEGLAAWWIPASPRAEAAAWVADAGAILADSARSSVEARMGLARGWDPVTGSPDPGDELALAAGEAGAQALRRRLADDRLAADSRERLKVRAGAEALVRVRRSPRPGPSDPSRVLP